ncbi:hypothetical protein [Tunturiibacter gelidoferens]|uniref:Uncharacterized protein n=1 Tax=Tunturiibacter lichenicola TaxID=2051959 RepID=A0A7Y9NMN7_9BACT|nr:hypothetical protein [Edaphobacter lichenicola]NYF52189.1 hypothetical protein [Edaphobacter lichenicola]
MKRIIASLLLLLPVSLTAGAEQLIPAGSVMQCMVSDKISSKTLHLGDPILCQLSRVEMYGRSVFPYGSYLVGRFEDYKDPGHFVGKGWMELKFDRIVVGNDTVIPISTRVIADSGKNRVDANGRILGTGHATRDTIEWLIPVLWPIDLINLPRRGPYPVLKPETRLTVKLLDDVGIPTKSEVQHQPEMISRFNYADPTPAPVERQPAPVQQAYPQPVQQSYAPPQQPYYPQQAPPVVVVQAQAPAPTIVQQPAPVVVRPHVVYGYPPPPPYGYPYPPPYGYYPNY